MSAVQFFLPYQTVTLNGVAKAGATLTFYLTGTTTKTPIYATSALTTQLANPLTSNGAARFADIYLSSAITYRLIMKDAAGTVLDDIDPVIPGTTIDLAQLLASVSNIPNATAHAATRGAMAALSSSGGPVYLTESGREGMFVWDSSNLSAKVTADTQQGVYVAPLSAPTGASGAWVRKFSGSLNVMWFGAVADDATNAATAINAAFRVSEALAVLGSTSPTVFRGGPPVYIPKGKYYITAALEPLVTVRLHGDGGLGWGAATQVRAAAGVTALLAQSYQTSGAGTVDVSNHFSGDRLVVQDIYFLGAFAGSEDEAHGCHAKRAIHVERCTFDNFEGDGFYINAGAGAGAPTEGNANVSRVTDCDFTNCRNGISMEGNDSNACTFIGCSLILNRRWGIKEDSFLGNHYFGHHFDGNGFLASLDGVTLPACLVSHGGNIYFVINGQDADASTNAPSGTTADNTWWGYWQAGAPAGARPAWVNGISVRSGGPILINGVSNASTIGGSHCESNGVSQVDQYAFMASGSTFADTVLVSAGVLTRNYGNILRPSNDGLFAPGNFKVGGDLTNFSGQITVDARTRALDILTNYYTGGTVIQENYRKADGSLFGSIYAVDTTGLHIDFVSGTVLRHNSTTVFSTTATGLTFGVDQAINSSNTAAPTTGAHLAGEIVFNVLAAPGGKVGWVCTTAGTPGTWKAFGPIDA